MSPGYPARNAYDGSGGHYNFFFGGQPSYTYTTITLHSSPSLLDSGVWFDTKTYTELTGLYVRVHSPVSVFTADSECIWLNHNKNDPMPAFLVSFQGIWYKSEAYRKTVCSPAVNQCGNPQPWLLGVILFH